MGSSPQVVDWNADCRRDLVSGDRNGYFNVFVDTGDGLKAYYQMKLMDSTIIDVGYNSQPAVTDWNRDHKIDLLLGSQDGYIRLYLNQTSDTWPMFRNYSYLQAGGVDINIYRINPYVVDLNQDGKRDLVCGEQNGYLHYYQNVGSDTNPTFSGKETLRTVSGTLIKPSGSYPYGSRCGFGDWNNDGVIDFLLSGYDGYVELYLGYRSKDVGVTQIVSPTGGINPTEPIVPQAKVKNYGVSTQSFNVTFKIGNIYFETRSKTLDANIEDTVNFPTWNPVTGTFITRCSTYLAGDTNDINDTLSGSVTVIDPTAGWQRMLDVPNEPSGKKVKRGSCIASLDGKIYLLKANNTSDFYSFSANSTDGNWAILDAIPEGVKASDDGKNPKKGAAIAAYGDKVYVLRGNNTLGFWAYTIGDQPGWQKLNSIPIGSKKVKGGSGLVYVNKDGENCIFAMKGSRTNEFYFYFINGDSWQQITSPSNGASGKIGYKKGSCLTCDGDSLVYVLKGYYGDFFKYNLLTNTWTELKRMDHKVFVNRDGKKKKVKDGSGLAYLNGAIYLLKGGNTKEFWKYEIDADNWLQMEPAEIWDIPAGSGKRVKSGGALCVHDNFFYALKGNNTPEFYRHGPPNNVLATNSTSYQTVMGKKITSDEFELTITPNPLINITTVKYNQPTLEPISFKLFNSYGRVVKSFTNSNPSKRGLLEIDGSELPSGIYILKVAFGNSTLTRKLVLNK